MLGPSLSALVVLTAIVTHITWLDLHRALPSGCSWLAWQGSQVGGGNALLDVSDQGILECLHTAEGFISRHKLIQLHCSSAR